MAPRPPKAKLPGGRGRPSKRQSAPAPKHPWDKGYKAAKSALDKINPFD